jgi:glyceraldehyde 3-phosphate dehydrogenase
MKNKIKVAINGFGRIGRLTSKIILETFDEEIDIIAINDISTPENLAYLFNFDSSYGKSINKMNFTEKSLIVNDKEILVFAEKDPMNLPWGKLNIDTVLECTGHFLSQDLASIHLKSGAKNVVLSAPAKDDSILTVVQGVNISTIHSPNLNLNADNNFINSDIVSNASCTTNCIAPLLKCLNDSYSIQNATALTVHAYTATQLLQDGPSKKDMRDGRAAAINMIPSKTGAAKAVEKVIPELKGKLVLSSLRVPIITASLIYLTVNLNSTVTKSEIQSLIENKSKNELKGIIEFSNDELVSTDIIRNSHSSVFDSNLTEVNNNTVKIVLWYDNEWGYASRLAESIILKNR